MQNFALKLATLLKRFEEKASSQLFLDLSPQRAMERFQTYLPPKTKESIFFAFPPEALIQILDEDFDINWDTGSLYYRKSKLDAQSLKRSHSLSVPLDEEKMLLAHKISQWLFDASRPLFKNILTPEGVGEIKMEFFECLHLYYDRYHSIYPQLLQQLSTGEKAHKEWLRFSHAMTVDAMFKKDAALNLFGEDSAYSLAWQRQELFRHRLTKQMEKIFYSTPH
jgi:hypothetical protein